MPRKKPTHGGARPNAGRPPFTGMASTPPVHYRVSAAQRLELDTTGAALGISGNQVAKLRAFPPHRVRKRKRD